jgi:DNA repair exonuclease SbcCD ATPase subunit
LFDGDLLLAFVFMAILFLRQITIIKQPNKINYSPLMIAIGLISSLVHFIIHPEIIDTVFIVRESLFPLLVSLLLYIVMNILHQTQKSEQARTQHEFTKTLIEQITQLKELASEVEKNMILNQDEDKKAQEEVRKKFKQDIQALETIQNNQNMFLEKFDNMDSWHKDVSKSFENFTEVQLPSLDEVVHKHIEILRIAEQDHFNKVKETLAKAVDSRCDIVEDIEEMKSNLKEVGNISHTISKSITKHTIEQLQEVTRPFEQQIMSLKSHSEGLSTTLYEGENILSNIKEQSEMIMKQMILSSKKMTVLESQNSGLHDVYASIKDLVSDIEIVKSDYVKSQAELGMIVKELKDSQIEEINSVKVEMEALIATLTNKIDNSLDKLHKHYNIANEDISKSVQFLAKQAQSKKGYSDLDS